MKLFYASLIYLLLLSGCTQFPISDNGIAGVQKSMVILQPYVKPEGMPLYQSIIQALNDAYAAALKEWSWIHGADGKEGPGSLIGDLAKARADTAAAVAQLHSSEHEIGVKAITYSIILVAVGIFICVAGVALATYYGGAIGGKLAGAVGLGTLASGGGIGVYGVFILESQQWARWGSLAIVVIVVAMAGWLAWASHKKVRAWVESKIPSVEAK